MIANKVPSLKARYAYKLLTNLTSLPLYFIMETILPRALGPQAYGNFYFVINIFKQLIVFLDMGTSSCFCTALARRPKSFSLVAFYAYISFAIFILTFLASFIVMFSPFGSTLMPNIPLWLIPLGALWAFLSWWSKLLPVMNDAIGLTAKSELIRSIFYIIAVMTLICLYFNNILSIKTLLLQQFIIVGLLSIVYYWLMRNYWLNFSFKLNLRQFKTFYSYFFSYSHPLFIQTLLIFIIFTFERWILQYFSGSAEQGYFILAHKISIACVLIVTAITPLIMRELSIAWSKHNLQLVGQLINKYAPSIYFLVAYFSCFVAIESNIVALVFGGSQFTSAAIPIKYMALFTIYQAYTYITYSFYLASGNTKYMRTIAIVDLGISLPLAWFLLAPQTYYGLHLGAAGLALKFVIVQFFLANFSFWLSSKLIPLNFWKIVLHEIITVVALLAAAFICYSLSTTYLQINSYVRFLLSGFFYSCLVLLLVILFPRLAGLNRARLYEYFNLLFTTLKIRK